MNVPVPKAARSNKSNSQSQEEAFLPLYVGTSIMLVVFLFGPLFASRGPNQGLTRWCIMLTAVCLWMFWAIVYIAQMNPLFGPRVDNASLAWLGHCWGLDPKKVGAREGLLKL